MPSAITRLANRTVRVALVQMQCHLDPDTNLSDATAYIEHAAAHGADIVCLPELFLSPYFCQTEDAALFDLAQQLPGPITAHFDSLATDLGVVIIASLFEQATAGLYFNTATVHDPVNGYLGKYRKMHIPDDPKYYEKFYFTPGDLGFRAFATSKASIGVLICWDQWFPEAARATALHGAEILFYPTAIGWHPDERETHGEAQHAAWHVSQRAHAVANGCFVVSVNRTGFEPTPGTDSEGLQFWGQSFVAAPDGTLLTQASETETGVLLADLDLGQIDQSRRGWPFLRDRRIDAYAPLSERYLGS
ncbi:MAG: carbon-nitrogen hydrolase [Rhodothermales bacterium]